MADDEGATPLRKIDDATHGRPPENLVRRRLLQMKRWALLDIDRNVAAAGLLAGSFAAIVLVGSFGPVSVQSFLTEGVSPGVVLVELLKAIVSVIVIVLSINQLVLSPGLGPVGDQQERFDQSLELRERVEAHTDVRVSPASPATFLVVLLDAIVDQIERVDELHRQLEGDTTSAGMYRDTDAVVDDARRVRERLTSARFGTFEVVSAALRFAMSEKIMTLRDARKQVDGTSSVQLEEALDELEELYELFTVSREYLKTVYIREEYIRLSQGLLYTGLPAIIVTYSAAQMYTPTVFPGQVVGFETQLLFVAAAVTVALTPLAVLLSYVSRLAALSRSTLFVGPFDARPSDEDREEYSGRGR